VQGLVHSHSFQRALLASANSGVAEKSPDDTTPKRRDSREKLATLQVIPMNIEKCFVAHKMLRSESHRVVVEGSDLGQVGIV
jgi:hypothetical protein